jgi:hypothetical protein
MFKLLIVQTARIPIRHQRCSSPWPLMIAGMGEDLLFQRRVDDGGQRWEVDRLWNVGQGEMREVDRGVHYASKVAAPSFR